MFPVASDAELLSAARIAEATGGVCVRGSGVARGVGTDSRTLRPGELFVALSGEDHDGHDWIAAAIARGAEGLLVTRCPETVDPDVFVVVVEDTRKALLDLARSYRSDLSGRVVAITGSCGKTSTKEMVAHLLAPEFTLVAAERSFNNAIGVPLTLFRMRANTELCVVEIGTNAPGEVAMLSAVAAPTIAVITTIGRSHLEGLGSVQGVFDEKAQLLDALPPDGTVILNADDPCCLALRQRAGRRTVRTFGVTHAADLRAESLRPTSRGVALRILDGAGRQSAVELRRPGQHNVRNLLAALLVGDTLGVGLEAMLTQLPTLPAPARRLESKIAPSGVRVLDDSYNANPESLLAALAVLDTSTGARRRILVLGDMLELGQDRVDIHRSFAPQLAGRVDVLVTVGPLAREAGDAFRSGGGIAVSFPDVDTMIVDLGSLFADGDLVLFKGSRRVGLDRAVDALVAPQAAPGAFG